MKPGIFNRGVKKVHNLQLAILYIYLQGAIAFMHENLCPWLNYGKYCSWIHVAT